MALVLADRVKETTSTSGTGAVTLGGASSGFQTFADAIGDANTTYYTIQDASGNWEVGEGTYTAASNTLSRTTVFDSSNSGNLVHFDISAKDVFVTLPASKVGGGGGSGTVTTVSVASANGFAGTVANATTTPAITLSTSVTGLLKGDGTAISAASAGVDYVAVNGALGTPISGNFSTGTFTWPTFNQNTTGTAAGLSSTLAIASGGTNATSYTAPVSSIAGLIWYDGTRFVNDASTSHVGYNATTNTFYANNINIGGTVTLASALPVGQGGTGLTTVPTNGQLLIGNGTNYTSANLTAGTGISISNGAGSITVTNSAPDQTVTLTAGANVTITGTYPSFTIAASGGGGGSSATPTVEGIVYAKTETTNQTTALGYSAGSGLTGGTQNTFIGYESGITTTNTSLNVGVGRRSLYSANANYNTAVGANSSYSITSGQQNLSVGYKSLYSGTTTSYNTALGSSALELNTSGSQNTAVGYYAGRSATSGSNNAFVGNWAGDNASGSGNVMVGSNAGQYSTSGTDVVAVGYFAGNQLGTGTKVTAIGSQSLANTTANNNTALGYFTGYNVSTGTNNTLVGYRAGNSGTNNLTTGSNNILIGADATASSATVSNEATWGNSSITSNRFWGDLKPGGSSAGTSGQVLTSQGAGLSPTWTTPSGGGGLTNWTDGISTSAPNATVPAAYLSATNAATNVDAVITPKGTGALLAAIPDSTATGGNKRGANAVDLQTYRTSASQVASGANSVVVGGAVNFANQSYSTVVGGYGNRAANGPYTFCGGGQSNQANWDYSCVLGGYNNKTQADYCFIGGGNSNTTNNSYAAVAGGFHNIASDIYSFVGGGNTNSANTYGSTIGGGETNTVDGPDCSTIGGGRSNNIYSGSQGSVIAGGVGNRIYNDPLAVGYSSIGGGSTNYITGSYGTIPGGTSNEIHCSNGTAFGAFALARQSTGVIAYSASNFPTAISGGVQSEILHLGKATSNTTPVVATSDGNAPDGTNQLYLPNYSAYFIKGTAVAQSNADAKQWEFTALVRRVGTVSIVGSPSITSSYATAGASGWSISVSADTVNNCFAVTVTGDSGVYFSIKLDALESTQ